MKKHSYHTQVLEQHLDTFGHVNNAVYLTLFEEARWQLITDHGYGMKEIQAAKQGPVILEVTVRFQKELKLRQKIEITTQLVDYSRVIAEMEQKILNDAGEVCATALFKFALFDLEKRRVIKPTKVWLDAIS